MARIATSSEPAGRMLLVIVWMIFRVTLGESFSSSMSSRTMKMQLGVVSPEGLYLVGDHVVPRRSCSISGIANALKAGID
jgi:hypothetical protein